MNNQCPVKTDEGVECKTEDINSHNTEMMRKGFICEIRDCLKKFSTKGNLKFHQMNIHELKKRFPCSFNGCKKSFVNKCKLQTHLNAHVNKKPFKCEYCTKSFSLKGNLKTHMRIHTGEKPYKCEFEECEATFKAIGQLNDHKKIHTNFKPFNCPTCEKKFRRKSSLKNHMTIHSNLKPFECSDENCKKRFKQNSNLLKHMRAIHKTIIKNDSGMKISTCGETIAPKAHDQDYIEIFGKYEDNFYGEVDELFGFKHLDDYHSSNNNYSSNVFEVNFDNFYHPTTGNINVININLKNSYEELDNSNSLLMPGYKY